MQELSAGVRVTAELSRLIQCLAVLASGVAIISVLAPSSRAESPPAGCKGGTYACEKVEVKLKRPPTGAGKNNSLNQGGGPPVTGERYKEAADDYTAATERFRTCLREAAASGGTSACNEPEGIQLPGSPDPSGVALLSPGQAGAIAVARLKIPTVAPGIGPSPDLNRWNMAAVGYPLWLWADGPTSIGPVSDSVAGMSVSLRAEVTSLTFRMGDGATVNCAGVGVKWTNAVEPGTKAPNCGHTYTKPSLPKGNYKVATLTEWAVTWTANGQSGVINVPAVQTTELPVGELQVLVR